MKMQKYIQKGFSLGEVLLSGFVLTTGLVAVAALISSSMQESFRSRDVIAATQLSQEGVELVRNVRDNNFASGGNGFGVGFSTNHHCRVDYSPTAFSCGNQDPTNNSSRYTLQYVSGFYRHNNTSGEKFSRYIYVDFNGSDAATVKSFVYWGSASPSGIDSGTTTNCVTSNKCVYTEVSLTSWL
ncbi:MAG: hypothetical protein HYV45_01285 [Candidatus Moranbacteria bacterium]|nr:hypothetical protein [Candidatus Moranbacteria bacterium]